MTNWQPKWLKICEIFTFSRLDECCYKCDFTIIWTPKIHTTDVGLDGLSEEVAFEFMQYLVLII